MFSEIIAMITFRNATNYSVPEMLAIIIVRNAANENFAKGSQLELSEFPAIMIFRAVNNYDFTIC